MLSTIRMRCLIFFILNFAVSGISSAVNSTDITVGIISSIPGATYTLEESTDLTNWSPAPEISPFVGDSLPHVAICDPGVAATIFFRWRVDGLLDPSQLATLSALVNTGDPTVDTDGDGFSDTVEQILGTSLNDASDNPAAKGQVVINIQSYTASANEDYTATMSGSTGNGTWTVTSQWSIGSKFQVPQSTDPTSGRPSPPGLDPITTSPAEVLGSGSLPWALSGPPSSVGYVDSYNVSSDTAWEEGWAICWISLQLTTNIPVMSDYRQSFLTVFTSTNIIPGPAGVNTDGSSTVVGGEAVILYIPKGQSLSNIYTPNLVPATNKGITATLCPLYVEGVTFSGSGYVELVSDDYADANPTTSQQGTKYSGPHYWDTIGDGDPQTAFGFENNYPVAYASGSTIQVAATLPGSATESGLNIYLRTDNMLPSSNAGVPCTVHSDSGLITTNTAIVGTSATPAGQIQYYNADSDPDAFKIDWQIKVGDNDTFHTFQTTKHTVYVTHAAPISQLASGIPYTSTYYESLFNIGCRSANEKSISYSTEQDIVNAIFLDFKNRAVSRAAPSSGSKLIDPNTTQAEKMLYRHNSTDAFSTKQLLGFSGIPAAGRCQAWANFFQDVLLCQGISSSYVEVWPPAVPNLPPAGVSVLFVDPGGWSIDSNTGLATHVASLPAQGEPDDTGAYNNHAVVIYPEIPTSSSWNVSLGSVYDSSYGGDPFPNLGAWLMSALYGYGYCEIPNPPFNFHVLNRASDFNPTLKNIFNDY